MARAKTKVGMMNLVYNMSRLVQFERGVAAPWVSTHYPRVKCEKNLDKRLENP